MTDQSPDILSTIIEITAEEADVDVALIDRDSRFTDFGIESLDLMVIATQTEERLGVTLEDSAILALKTVGDLADLVARLRA